MNRLPSLALAFVAAAIGLSLEVTLANPYASAITNDHGTIRFYLNESGAKVTVVYEDGTTNANFNGTTTGLNVPSGPTSFLLGAHTGYQIICAGTGNGTPFQISTDCGPTNNAPAFTGWNVPRGVDANKNPKIGYLFGRVYIGNAGTNAAKQWGIYALTPDLSAKTALGAVTANDGLMWFGQWALDANAGSATGPYRMTVAPDSSLYVTDYGTPGGTVWQFGPNFEYTNLVLYPVGQNQGIAAGTHADPIGVFAQGSIATGDLKVWTFDPELGAPATAILGLGGGGGSGPTLPGNYNNLFRYDIGAGPLPWNHPPNFAVSLGLPGINFGQFGDVCVGADGKLIGMFRRANFSDGNIQVFDPITGARLYDSLHDTGGGVMLDVFTGSSTPGTPGLGAYAGVRVSPDGRYLATATINNVIEIARLTNGIPDEGTLITIANTPSSGNSRGIAWDAADNLYVCSSGQGLLRYWSLGSSVTTISSNDFTGTNGTFTLIPNRAPTAPAVSAATRQNQPISIPAEKLLATAADPDGDTLTLSGVSATSTNGGSVSLVGGMVTYAPASGFIGADRFTYTVSDGRGGSTSGFVFVQVRSAGQGSGNMLSPVPIPGGYQVSFLGIPGRTYTLQRAANVAGPWTTLGPVPAGANGLGTFADTNAPPPGAFYRTTYP